PAAGGARRTRESGDGPRRGPGTRPGRRRTPGEPPWPRVSPASRRTAPASRRRGPGGACSPTSCGTRPVRARGAPRVPFDPSGPQGRARARSPLASRSRLLEDETAEGQDLATEALAVVAGAERRHLPAELGVADVRPEELRRHPQRPRVPVFERAPAIHGLDVVEAAVAAI